MCAEVRERSQSPMAGESMGLISARYLGLLCSSWKESLVGVLVLSCPVSSGWKAWDLGNCPQWL